MGSRTYRVNKTLTLEMYLRSCLFLFNVIKSRPSRLPIPAAKLLHRAAYSPCVPLTHSSSPSCLVTVPTPPPKYLVKVSNAFLALKPTGQCSAFLPSPQPLTPSSPTPFPEPVPLPPALCDAFSVYILFTDSPWPGHHHSRECPRLGPPPRLSPFPRQWRPRPPHSVPHM